MPAINEILLLQSTVTLYATTDYGFREYYRVERY